MKFYITKPTFCRWGDIGSILAHGMVWTKEYRKETPAYNDPPLHDIADDAPILMRTGAFIPPLCSVTSSKEDASLYCTEKMKASIAREFPYITFSPLPKGRIVELNWQDWDASEEMPWLIPAGEYEDYILKGYHSEQASQAIGELYWLHIPHGGETRCFDLTEEVKQKIEIPPTQLYLDFYYSFDTSTWNGNHLFTDDAGRTIVSQITKSWMLATGLGDYFDFMELMNDFADNSP